MPDPMCYEKPKSRGGQLSGGGRTLTLFYFIIYCADEGDALQLARDTTPATHNGMTRQNIDLAPLGYGMWDVTVPYSLAPIEGLTPDVLSFKVGNGTAHVTQSRRTKFRRQAADNALEAPTEPDPDDYEGGLDDEEYQADYETYLTDLAALVGTAPDTKGAIGLDGETIAGCDVVVPQMEFSYTTQRAAVDLPYLITLFNLVGKTNSKSFLGFNPGTLLYLGAEPTSARAKLADGSEFPVWNLVHSFRYNPARVNVNIGGIDVPRIGGHEYTWVRYSYGDSAGKIVRPPSAVYVEQVYDEGNFDLLEIPAFPEPEGDEE